MKVPDSLVYVNGINGTRGGYLVSPLSLDQIGTLARADEDGRGVHRDELVARNRRDAPGPFALAPGLDHGKLSETGWGVIFPPDLDPSVREALQPLLDLRRAQAQAAPEGKEHYFKEYVCHTGTSKQQFLIDNGASVGAPADPEYMPYYLLIVASPEHISYRFQYELDVEYAVGRLWFEIDGEPDAAAFDSYARSVVAAEQGLVLPRRALFFSVRNPGDPATGQSSTMLITPLHRALSGSFPNGPIADPVAAGAATKDRLASILNGGETPALLFTSSHGMGFEKDDPRQLRHQGALLCSDCPDPFAEGAIAKRYYLAAEDVGSDARLLGRMAFFFACYGAGTPALDDFPHERQLRADRPIAPHAFVAALPQRLLGHPRGGALAVVGHVERAWSYSFQVNPAQPQIQVFQAALKQLLKGLPVGAAMEVFNQKYAALATVLTSQLQKVMSRQALKESDYLTMSWTWTNHNDARSYVVLGDPAVRLNLDDRAADATPVLAPARPAELAIPLGKLPPKTAPSRTAGPPAGTATVESDLAPAGDVPFDPALLKAAEERYRALTAARPASFSLSHGAARGDALLRSNPPGTLARRLRRLGFSDEEAAAAEQRLASASFATGIRGSAAGLVGLERIIGRNMLLGIQYLDAGRLAARTVGRIEVRDESGQTVALGTGSLVAPCLLLTNHHVMATASEAGRSLIQFDYQYDLAGRLLRPATFAFEPDRFFLTSPVTALDFTLVAVKVASDDGRSITDFGHNRLGALQGEIVAGECVTVIQHPGGEPKQIALRENLVLKLPASDDRFLHYQTDTTPGSSGSPVFNDQWEVVALHHAGVPRRDTENRILARDSQPWSLSMGEHRIDWVANEGVRTAAIVAHLARASGLSGEAQELLGPILEAARRSWGGPAPPAAPMPPTQQTDARGLLAAEVPAPSSAAATHTGATWTLPIQVTIEVGPADGSGPPAPPTADG